MTHILVRAECRDNEKRVGITPLEAKNLLKMALKNPVQTKFCKTLKKVIVEL